MNNEQIIRRAYERAEEVDVKGWVECFTPDGTFTDMSIGVTYRGPDGPTGLGKTVEVYAKSSSWSSPSRVRTRDPWRRLWGSFRQRASGWMRRAVTSSVS
jgi:hypothetical protein